MKTNFKLKALLFAFCILLVVGWVYAVCGTCGHPYRSEAQKASCGTGKDTCFKKVVPAEQMATAPVDFTLTDINGKQVQLSKLRGKFVVLEWTNYDCPFVKPHYTPEKQTTAEITRKYADNDVIWLTINSTYYATAEATKAWAEKLNLPQTILMDTDGKVGRLLGATNTPHIFILGKDGKILYRGTLDNAPLGKPADDFYINYADRALGELTAGKPVSIIETRAYGCTVKYPPEK